MANIYISDEVKKDLDNLAVVETRSIKDEVEFLIRKRIKELTDE
jgi:hypothetical protein